MSRVEREAIETGLEKLSSDYGFLLPNGSIPSKKMFSEFTVTGSRRELFSNILKILQPRNKVVAVRKQLFLYSMEKSKTKNSVPTVTISSRLQQQLDGWRKMEKMKEKIRKLEEEIKDLKLLILKLGGELQTYICKIAEKEKDIKDLKEKKILMQILKKSYMEKILTYQDMLKELNKPVFEGKTNLIEEIEESGTTCNCKSESNDSNCEIMKKIEVLNPSWDTSKLLADLATMKKAMNHDLESFVYGETECTRILSHCKAEEEHQKALLDNIKLTTVNHWLRSLVNKEVIAQLKSEQLVLMDKAENLLLYGGHKDSFELSASTDLLNRSEEEFVTVKRAIKIKGLLKLKRGLELQIETLEKLNNSVLVEPPITVDCLDQMQEELKNLMDDHKLFEENLRLTHADVVNQCKEMQSKKKDFEAEVTSYLSSDIKDLVLYQTTQLLETPLDALRVTKKGKTILESDAASLWPLSGEHSSLWSAVLFSPWQPIDSILKKIKTRRKFLLALEEVLLYDKEGYPDLKVLCLENPRAEEEIEHAGKMLAVVKKKSGKIADHVVHVKKLLKCWEKQPFGKMVKDWIPQREIGLDEMETELVGVLRDLAYYKAML